MDRDDVGLADALAGVVVLLASLLIGVTFAPVRDSIGLENVAILYMAVVAAVAAGSGRVGGLIAATAAALSYNFFFTSPYYSLRIDSASQVVTVLLLFLAGLLASFVGGLQRRLRSAHRQEEAALVLVHQVVRTRAEGGDAPRAAVSEIWRLLGARWVAVVRDGASVADAGEKPSALDPLTLPEFDDQGYVHNGHRLEAVLPAGGAAVPLRADGQRTGALVIVPRRDRTLSRPLRLALLAVAYEIAGEPPIPRPAAE
jgi:K+-sensing histidine kinase KdpD